RHKLNSTISIEMVLLSLWRSSARDRSRSAHVINVEFDAAVTFFSPSRAKLLMLTPQLKGS
ncbi:MAG: hypothetical protein AAFV54_11315, partial [Pseudomonadota bacterium]